MAKKKVWIGIDPGIGITGFASITKVGRKMEVWSETLESKHSKYKDYRPHLLTYMRNGMRTLMRRHEKDEVVGVGIEVPFGMQGNAIVLAELLGIYITAVYDGMGTFNVPVHRLSQASVKAFATQKKGAKKSDLVLRASDEWKFTATTEDEIEAFWMALFVFCLTNRPKQEWRVASIERYKKKNPWEMPDYGKEG